MADPDAIRYLRIAQADLAEAQRMVEVSGFRDSSIGFLLQQACEKALNSWIHSRGLEITPPEWSLLLGVTSSLLTEAQRQLS
jgi:hypothetical protein